MRDVVTGRRSAACVGQKRMAIALATERARELGLAEPLAADGSLALAVELAVGEVHGDKRVLLDAHAGERDCATRNRAKLTKVRREHGNQGLLRPCAGLDVQG